MSVSLNDICDAIDGLLQRSQPRYGDEEDDHVYKMIFSLLDRSRNLFGGSRPLHNRPGLVDGVDDFFGKSQIEYEGESTIIEDHYEELYRVVRRISTQLEKHQAGEDIWTPEGEYMLDNLLDLRWWTLVISTSRHGHLKRRGRFSDLEDIEPREDFLIRVNFREFMKDVSDAKVSIPRLLNDSGVRSLPSLGLEQWMPEVWKHVMQTSPYNKRSDAEDQQVNMLLTEIRKAELPVFEIKLSTTVREAQKPSSMQDHLEIDLTRDFLGASSGGYVIRTTCLGETCALKRIDTMDDNPPDLARLSHPHVVHLKHHWSEKSGPHDEACGLVPKLTFMTFLVMEFMDGDLAKLMRTQRAGISPFSLPVSIDLMLQIAKGMLYLHEMGNSHPHLRSENILCRIETNTETFRVGDVLVKLGGFGCPRPANANSKNRDIFFFGLTCLEILTGDEAIDMNGPRPTVPETTPPVLKYCIESCLDPELTASKLAFPEVVMLLLVAKLEITGTYQDGPMMLPSTSLHVENVQPENQDSASSSRSNCGLREMFHVHQLHPQPEEEVSASNQMTLIFFHGFPKVSEEWRMTWMTRDNQLLWPEKWLPADVCHDIRVLSVSYDDHLDVSSDEYLLEISKNVLQSLVLSAQWKLGEKNQAVSLVGHGFGGVIIKALVSEAQKESKKLVRADSKDFVGVMKCRTFLENLASTVFFAVPHALMDTEFENYLSGCSNTRVLQRSSLLKSLRGKRDRFVQDMIQLSANFESAVPKMKVLAFLEGKPMIKKTFLVTGNSCEGPSLNWERHTVAKDNHFEVSRPDSKDHAAYKTLVQHLIEEHMDIQKKRLTEEPGVQQQGTENKNVEKDVNSSRRKSDLTTFSIIVSGSKNLTSLFGSYPAPASLKFKASWCLSLTDLPYDFSGLKHLQSLDVSGCENLTSLASNARATTLRKLKASGCLSLRELPDDFSALKWLYSLDVSGCENLTSLAGIARATTLRKLKASGCLSLRELPDDFSALKWLYSLDVSGCENLTSLAGIARVATLRELKASGCSSLRELPDEFGGLRHLEFLGVSGCKNLTSVAGIARARTLRELKASGCSSLRELPGDFSELKDLESLDVSGCENLTSLAGIARAATLRVLKASGCSSLRELPDDFSGLKHLRSLDVSGCKNLTSLAGIARAATLRELKASGCSSLRELPDDFSGLKDLVFLDVSGCENLTRVAGIARARAASLGELKASGCSSLRELQDDFGGLKYLRSLDVSGCKNLTSLACNARVAALQKLKAFFGLSPRELANDFSGLKHLRSLDVSGCENLTSLAGIARVATLRELKAFDCSSLRELRDDFRGLKHLEFLDVSGCENLTSLAGIARATTLRKLKASGCLSLRELPDDFSALKWLYSLDVSGCENLTSLAGIARVATLRELKASGCSSLRELPDDFSELKDLESLDVSGCENLTSLVGIARAATLRVLKASGCSSLRELPDEFSELKDLESLDVSGCENLTSIACIARAARLRVLEASGCLSLRELPDDFSELKDLESLDVSGCKNLTSLAGIACAQMLQELKACGCSRLRELPDDFSALKQLRSLDVSGCVSVLSFSGIARAPALQKLKASTSSRPRELLDDFRRLK